MTTHSRRSGQGPTTTVGPGQNRNLALPLTLTLLSSLVVIGTYLAVLLTQPADLGIELGHTTLWVMLGYLAGGALLASGTLPLIPRSVLALIPVAVALNIVIGQVIGNYTPVPLYLDPSAPFSSASSPDRRRSLHRNHLEPHLGCDLEPQRHRLQLRSRVHRCRRRMAAHDSEPSAPRGQRSSSEPSPVFPQEPSEPLSPPTSSAVVSAPAPGESSRSSKPLPRDVQRHLRPEHGLRHRRQGTDLRPGLCRHQVPAQTHHRALSFRPAQSPRAEAAREDSSTSPVGSVPRAE